MNPRCLYFSLLFSITSRITIVTVRYSIVSNVIANEPAERRAGEMAENSAARRMLYAEKILDRPMKV